MQRVLDNEIKMLDGRKPNLLLHSCCGPCSTAGIERLAEDWDITVFYFNPNITDPDEYEHRKAAKGPSWLSKWREKYAYALDDEGIPLPPKAYPDPNRKIFED